MKMVLLDTGILLRLLNADDPLHGPVRSAAKSLRRQGRSFCASVQNMAEFWNVITRPAMARGGLGLDLEVVERRVQAIDRWCQILIDSESSYRQWRSLIVTHAVTGVSVHDARIVAVMLAHNIPTLLTLNDRDFRRYESNGIEVVTPAMFTA